MLYVNMQTLYTWYHKLLLYRPMRKIDSFKYYTLGWCVEHHDNTISITQIAPKAGCMQINALIVETCRNII